MLFRQRTEGTSIKLWLGREQFVIPVPPTHNSDYGKCWVAEYFADLLQLACPNIKFQVFIGNALLSPFPIDYRVSLKFYRNSMTFELSAVNEVYPQFGNMVFNEMDSLIDYLKGLSDDDHKIN